ncbi:hypothetical protein [Novipirellula sp.]|uniref:hypothetical protein n=1 Tax=Novipirellula sp. TaxID=2795430 RepID=UPI003563DBE2
MPDQPSPSAVGGALRVILGQQSHSQIDCPVDEFKLPVGLSANTIEGLRINERAIATANARQATRRRADGMIWATSCLPLVTLSIISLAIANRVIAAGRSLTWLFGVMRAIGTTRSQSIRVVLAETSLIGLSAFFAETKLRTDSGLGTSQYGGCSIVTYPSSRYLKGM